MAIPNNFYIIFVYFIIFCKYSSVCHEFCKIDTSNGCFRVYNTTWKIQTKLNEIWNLNLCNVHKKRCESIEVVDADDIIPISKGNYTFHIGFHCEIEKKSIVHINDTKNILVKLPSTNCDKIYCLFDIRGTQDLRMNLTDFQTLETESGRQHFYLKICNVQTLPTVEVCSTKDISSYCIIENNKTIIFDIRNWELSYSIKTGLQLHGIGLTKITISINCDPDIMYKFTYIRKHKKTYFFTLISSKLCMKLPIDFNLSIKDEENFLYDLSNLKQNIWNIRLSHSTSIFFNVGKALNPIEIEEPINLGERNIFACLFDHNKKNCSSLGSVTNGLIIEYDALKLIYSAGDMCQHFGAQKNLTIIFQCSSVTHAPVIERIDQHYCSFIVNWKTSEACPHIKITGKHCAFRDEVASLQTFDFSALKNKVQDHTIRTNVGNLYLNLCDAIHFVCNNTSNTSLCLQKTNGENIAFGTINSSPIFEDGSIKFNFYSRHICKSKIYYSAQLNLICDELDTNNPTPIIIPESSDSCKMQLQWKSSLACVKPLEVPCFISNTSYNFTSLTSQNGYYKVPYKNITFALNICKSVLFGPETLYLGGNPGIVIINRTEKNIKKRIKKLAYISDGLEFDARINLTRLSYISANNMMDNVFLYFKCDPASQMQPKIVVDYVNTTKIQFSIFTTQACLANLSNSNNTLDWTNKAFFNCTIIAPSNMTKELIIGNSDFKIITSFQTYLNKYLGVAEIFENMAEICLSIISFSNMCDSYLDIPLKNIISTSQNRNVCLNSDDSNHMKKLCSRITINLKCDHHRVSGLSTLYDLKLTDSCEQIFKWNSIAFCTSNPGIYFEQNQTLLNPILNRQIDLSTIIKPNSLIKFKTSNMEKIVDVQIEKYNLTMDYYHKLVYFSFMSRNSTCPDESYTTVFNLYCNTNATYIEVNQEFVCGISFNWYLRETCYLLGLEDTLIYTRNNSVVIETITNAKSSLLLTGLLVSFTVIVIITAIVFYAYKRCVLPRLRRENHYHRTSSTASETAI